MRINTQGRQVLRWNGALYDLEDVTAIAKRQRIQKVAVTDLNKHDSHAELSPPFPNPVLDEVVYTEHKEGLVILMGRHKVAQAESLERTELPGRFISPYALKAAKIQL